jgi:hypothetical protein
MAKVIPSVVLHQALMLVYIMLHFKLITVTPKNMTTYHQVMIHHSLKTMILESFPQF